jgi:hypothetical protein
MTKQLIVTKQPSAFQIIFARVALVFALLYSILLLSLHFIKPELDFRWRFISEYALGKYGWVMTLTFVSIAISQLGIVFVIWSHIKTWIGYIGVFLLCLSSIGYLITAIFPTDLVTVSQDALSASGKMHVFGASLDWTPIAALLISLSLARTQRWYAKKKQMLVAAAVTVVLTIAFIISIISAPNGVIGPCVYAGFIGRLLIWSYIGWISIISLHVIKSRSVDLSTLSTISPYRESLMK